MIQTLFSIDAFVHNVKEWNKKKKILSGFIEKQEYFRRPNTNFDTTRYGKDTKKLGEFFMKTLDKEFKIFSKECGFKEINLTDIWAIKYKQHDYQIPHHHGRSMYTGILYLNLAKEQDTTTYISPSPSEISGATRLVKIEAKEGSLVVFPGHLLHFVDPNPINKERIVVSFDINCYPK